MTQKKSIASKLLLAAIALTLISFCFLGSTFARYTSSSSGSASLDVAKWSVSIPADSTVVDFEQLSPSMAEYVDTPRTNSTGKIPVATITNSGDVNAEVTLVVDDLPTLTNTSGDWGGYSDTEIQGLFSIKLYTNTSNDAAGATEWDGSRKFQLNVDGDKELYIFAEVIWTSDVGGKTGDGADARDTWVGENITKVSYNISYTAVQTSELPNA